MSKYKKLTKQQIQTLKDLKHSGVRMSFIAKVFHVAEGVALSATYYHISDNRDAYDNLLRKEKLYKKQKICIRISNLIDEGMNTQSIAEEWNIPLKVLNKIYTQ